MILTYILSIYMALINPNLKCLIKARADGKAGAVLEGGSRSGKTWSGVDFIVYLTSKIEAKAKIIIIRETYNSFKTTLYEDFNRRLPAYGIKSPFEGKKEVSQFNLFGSTIHLMGADNVNTIHGVGSDYFFVNELIPIRKDIFDNFEQRCRKFWWVDYNPSATQHWCYNSLWNRPDVDKLKTTLLDNPYISANEKKKILGYEPTHPEDRDLPIEKRRPHPFNIENGTAEDFMWNVYGLGIRSSPEGLVFQHVTWIERFPENIERIYYGSDFGETSSPSTLVKVGVHNNNIYLEKKFYEPTPTSNEYLPLLKKYVGKQDIVWADEAGAQFIIDAQKEGYKVIGFRKFPGSIRQGINVIKKYKIHIVDSKEFRNEQENYKYRHINGINTGEPIDNFNHLWDPTRYVALANLVYE